MITGCLKITKESIFTGTNNFVSDSISSARLDEYFGFTGNDVKRLLESADLENMERESKAGMTDIILVMLTCIVPGM